MVVKLLPEHLINKLTWVRVRWSGVGHQQDEKRGEHDAGTQHGEGAQLLAHAGRAEGSEGCLPARTDAAVSASLQRCSAEVTLGRSYQVITELSFRRKWDSSLHWTFVIRHLFPNGSSKNKCFQSFYFKVLSVTFKNMICYLRSLFVNAANVMLPSHVTCVHDLHFSSILTLYTPREICCPIKIFIVIFVP